MELIDQIIDWQPGKQAAAMHNITMSHPVFDTHFPLRPIWPGNLTIMSMQQLAEALLAAAHKGNRFYRLTGLQRIKWRHYIQPGDRVRIEVTVTAQEEHSAKVKASARIGDQVVVSVREMAFAAEHLEAPQAVRLENWIARRRKVNGWG